MIEKLVKFIGIVVLAAAVIIVLCIPFTLLWNWLMPLLFGLKKITIWQGIGILALSEMLFKNSSKS